MPPFTEEQVSAFHEDGYLIVPGLFDSEEADILRKAAHADSSFGENAYDLEDGEGGKAQLVLWNKAGEDLWGAIARSERIVNAMEQLFDDFKPDLVVGFICVTLGDYLACLFAKARGIPYLNLRPTRVQDCIYAGEGIPEWSESFVRTYQDERGFSPASDLVERAENYLVEVRDTHARYEGIIRPSAMPPSRRKQPIWPATRF